jgi:uncharacterized protein
VSGDCQFEWDERKNEANLRKHGISFEEAMDVFADEHRVEFIDRIEAGEERWHVIGFVPHTPLLLLVVHAYPEPGNNNFIRLISARRATKREREIYGHENAC